MTIHTLDCEHCWFSLNLLQYKGEKVRIEVDMQMFGSKELALQKSFYMISDVNHIESMVSISEAMSYVENVLSKLEKVSLLL